MMQYNTIGKIITFDNEPFLLRGIEIKKQFGERGMNKRYSRISEVLIKINTSELFIFGVHIIQIGNYYIQLIFNDSSEKVGTFIDISLNLDDIKEIDLMKSYELNNNLELFSEFTESLRK